MDIGIALRSHLLTDGDVSARLGTRIYPNEFPQAPVYPAATYSVIYAANDYTNDGPSGLVHARVQFDVYAKSYADVNDARKSIVTALNGWKGLAGSPALDVQGVFWINQGDLPVPELKRAGPGLHRRTLEATVWYQEN